MLLLPKYLGFVMVIHQGSLSSVDAFKILIITSPAKSIVFGMVAIADELTSRGHNATVLVGDHYPLDIPESRHRDGLNILRYDDLTEEGLDPDYEAMMENFSTNAAQTKGNILKMLPLALKMMNAVCGHTAYHNEKLMERLKTEKFDLAVVAGIFFLKCLYLVPHGLRIPTVTYTFITEPWLVRVPFLSSFVPNPVFPFTERMTFTERLTNTVVTAAFIIYSPFPDPAPEVLDRYRKLGGPFDRLDDLAARSVLWLAMTDSVLNYAQPTMPNVIQIGGLTVGRTAGKLPTDLEDFINGSRMGAILVTFGSTKSTFTADVVEKFAAAFRRLDGYRVIWRLDNKDKVDLPDNVMISRWLPQNDILAHPKIKLFITHCGMNGLYEAIYHGVPTIGFPLFSDQINNAPRLDYKGYGISMDIYTFTSDQLVQNINEILADKSYKERMMKASEIFRSQPQTPVERASFWIEHVCRFGGDHLRSAGSDLPLYSYLMLDVLAFMLAVLGLIIFISVKLIVFVARRCRGQRKETAIRKVKIN